MGRDYNGSTTRTKTATKNQKDCHVISDVTRCCFCICDEVWPLVGTVSLITGRYSAMLYEVSIWQMMDSTKHHNTIHVTCNVNMKTSSCLKLECSVGIYTGRMISKVFILHVLLFHTDNAILLNYCKAVVILQSLLSSVNAFRGLFLAWRIMADVCCCDRSVSELL